MNKDETDIILDILSNNQNKVKKHDNCEEIYIQNTDDYHYEAIVVSETECSNSYSKELINLNDVNKHAYEKRIKILNFEYATELPIYKKENKNDFLMKDLKIMKSLKNIVGNKIVKLKEDIKVLEMEIKNES